MFELFLLGCAMGAFDSEPRVSASMADGGGPPSARIPRNPTKERQEKLDRERRAHDEAYDELLALAQAQEGYEVDEAEEEAE